VIEPNNFSPPAFATILISIAFKASATASSLITLVFVCSLFLQLKFFAEDVAKCACPCGIKSYDRIRFSQLLNHP
jgi:hypothetical protein